MQLSEMTLRLTQARKDMDDMCPGCFLFSSRSWFIRQSDSMPLSLRRAFLAASNKLALEEMEKQKLERLTVQANVCGTSKL